MFHSTLHALLSLFFLSLLSLSRILIVLASFFCSFFMAHSPILFLILHFILPLIYSSSLIFILSSVYFILLFNNSSFQSFYRSFYRPLHLGYSSSISLPLILSSLFFLLFALMSFPLLGPFFLFPLYNPSPIILHRLIHPSFFYSCHPIHNLTLSLLPYS